MIYEDGGLLQGDEASPQLEGVAVGLHAIQ